MRYMSVKQYLLHRNKSIPLLQQFIHRLQRRLHRGLIVVMHQDDIVLIHLADDLLSNAVRIAGAPVQRVHCPQHGKHIQFFLKALVPGAVGWANIDHFLPGDLLQNLIGLYQLFLEHLTVSFSQLDVAVCMVADQMPLLLHTPYDIRMELRMFPCDKKGGADPPLLQPVQQLLRIAGMGTVIC